MDIAPTHILVSIADIYKFINRYDTDVMDMDSIQIGKAKILDNSPRICLDEEYIESRAKEIFTGYNEWKTKLEAVFQMGYKHAIKDLLK